MNYSGIIKEDISNGPGIRLSLFVSGCPFCCKGCFNEVAWDYLYGKEFTKEVEKDIIGYFKDNSLLNGFSLLGGEPFARLEQKDYLQLINLIHSLKANTKCKSFWVWSGYTFEEIIERSLPFSLLKEFDVLVDGTFIQKKKDLKLPYRGSNNQRIIDIQKSIKRKEIVLWENL